MTDPSPTRPEQGRSPAPLARWLRRRLIRAFWLLWLASIPVGCVSLVVLVWTDLYVFEQIAATALFYFLAGLIAGMLTELA